jgi:hypothetical protein
MYGRMVHALPAEIKDIILAKIHGDPSCREHYLVKYDPMTTPIDLVNDSAYPPHLRQDVPPGFDGRVFVSLVDATYDFYAPTNPPGGGTTKRHAFVDVRTGCPCCCPACVPTDTYVWVWAADEEPKDSHWERRPFGTVAWSRYGVNGLQAYLNLMEGLFAVAVDPI